MDDGMSEINREGFKTMHSMLDDIELKTLGVEPLRLRGFYKFIQDVIYEAWVDARNPEDEFLYGPKKAQNG